MYKVEVECQHLFVPLMDEHGPGIGLMRTIELPFAPTSDLTICGKQLDTAPGPAGITLTDITWDMDREVFLATCTRVAVDFPIAIIPGELQSWVDLGWRFGSHEETYDTEAAEQPETLPPLTSPDTDNDETMNRWLTERPAKRPPAFNLLLKAMVRTMAKLLNNWDVAYAIDKTQMFFTDRQLKDDSSAAADRWRKARSAFQGLSPQQKFAWRDRVMRKYPHIKQFVLGLQSGHG